MSLEAFAKKLHNDGVGRIGTNIFLNHAVENIETGILLRDHRSPIDHELPNYNKVKFQGIVWSKDYKAGYALARKMMTSLTIKNQTMENMDIRYVRANNMPVCYPISDSSTYEFLVIFEAVYVIV